jgi:transposase
MTGVTQIEEIIAIQIKELMKKGKARRPNSWELKSIINKIGEEFGRPYEDWAYKYIMRYCEISYELWRK